jgi:MbtH protein
MSSNPFEDRDATYSVLRNDEGQYSLWPSVVKIPSGWSAVHEGSRDSGLEYIAARWCNLCPSSVRLPS